MSDRNASIRENSLWCETTYDAIFGDRGVDGAVGEVVEVLPVIAGWGGRSGGWVVSGEWWVR